MTTSKTFHIERSDNRSQTEREGQKPVSGWAILGRWVLGFVVALALSAQVDARTVKTDKVVEGRIVGVTDGDTVDLLTDDLVQQRIRLRGIDAPEKRQAFGNRSKQVLSALVFGRRVTVAYSKVDRHKRWVGRIKVGDVDVSRAMVEQGMAWRFTFYEREQPVEERVGDAAAEEAARLERRGLWVDEAPVAPWDFRAAKRQSSGQIALNQNSEGARPDRTTCLAGSAALWRKRSIGGTWIRASASSTLPCSHWSQSPGSMGTTARLSGGTAPSGLCIRLNNGWPSQFWVSMV